MKKDEFQQIKYWMQMNGLNVSDENVYDFLSKTKKYARANKMTMRKAYSEVLKSQRWAR